MPSSETRSRCVSINFNILLTYLLTRCNAKTIVRPYPAMFASGVGFVKVFLLKICPQYGYQSVILQ